jgi:hypothetical protein
VSRPECEKKISETWRIFKWISREIAFSDVDRIVWAFVNTAMDFMIS